MPLGTASLGALPLATPWLALPLAVVAVAGSLRAAPRFRGRGRGLAASTLLLAMAAYANAYFGYLPRVGDLPAPPRPAPQVAHVLAGWHGGAGRSGRLTSLSVPALRGAPATGRALVWLPPQYAAEPARRFPVLYLLHGSPGVPEDWFRGGEAEEAGLLAARAGRPVVLVAPRMSRGWLDDSECVDRPGFAVETHLVQQVVPAVDRALRTLPSRTSRGVAGNSSGGYCALDVGLRHPDVFGAVLALSALTRPTYSYGTLADLFGHPAGLDAVVAAHVPAELLRRDPAARRTRLRLDVGAQDPLRSDDQELASTARALGVRVELRVRPGGHTFRVWRPALRQGVDWFARVADSPGSSAAPDEPARQQDRPTRRAALAGGGPPRRHQEDR